MLFISKIFVPLFHFFQVFLRKGVIFQFFSFPPVIEKEGHKDESACQYGDTYNFISGQRIIIQTVIKTYTYSYKDQDAEYFKDSIHMSNINFS